MSNVKLPAYRAGLPGHAVASGMRANEILFIVPLDPAYPARGGTGHLPVKIPACGRQANVK
jgi:hypothetical protein